MSTKRIITICQSGGEFKTDESGSLSYSGGVAYAVDINQETKLKAFRKELVETFGCTLDRMSIKYFLPENDKTLVSISKDKDLESMLNLFEDSDQVNVFVTQEECSAPKVSKKPVKRSKNIAVSEDIVPTLMIPSTSNTEVNVPIDMDNPIATSPFDNIIDIDIVDSQTKLANESGAEIISVGQRFRSFSEFREALLRYSIAHGFIFRYKKNDSYRISARCKYEGCPWRIYASRVASTTQLFCIKKMNPNHLCERADSRTGYRASKGWVGSIVKEKLKTSTHFKAKDIATIIEKEYGVVLNPAQANRAKLLAKEELSRSYEDAYNQLPYLCEKILESNPGSIAALAIRENSSFLGVFVSFHALISGFQLGCRPLIFIDSIPLRSKYQGVLIVASAPDGDDGIFPVAFSVVDVESEENWLWFIMELKSALSTSHPITFVADFRRGLREAINQMFDNGQHGFCIRHLVDKLNEDIKDLPHETRSIVNQYIFSAAYTPTVDTFRQYIEKIESVSPEVYNWVVQSEVHHWANAFFTGARYNHLTCDFGRIIYSWVADAHEFPITQLLDVLINKTMELVYTRRADSSKWITKLTPSMEEKLKCEISKISSLQVFLSHDDIYEVHGESVDVVDIEHWDCSCRGWQLTGFPCSHAIAVLEFLGRDLYSYCSKYFTVESYCLTYAESVHPIPIMEKTEQSKPSTGTILVTPPTKRSSLKRLEQNSLSQVAAATKRKRKKKQSASLELSKRQFKCSRCKGLGHNKKTCSASNSDSSSEEDGLDIELLTNKDTFFPTFGS
ncbi:uncharacterized protein LOC124914143 [Impatiens glandulifera]|uniref:uncharacterized protein LOC124914143 n=1 Tax=Impatiens glandulifera TaxID=253017 RepID=UPI001FB064BB|nr:uncharacterized protein LOC124914143 [Impatiens glandulifera]